MNRGEDVGIAFGGGRIPQVSIGMPVHNGGRFIRDALNSLLTQTFTDFELIISDNASTDETHNICRTYSLGDGRIRYIRQETNIGAAKNFEVVLGEAHGRYFMWAAHDDRWLDKYLEYATTLLDEKDVDFAFPTFCVESIRLRLKKRFDASVFEFVESRDRKERVLSFLNLHHSSYKCNLVYSLFRREFLNSALSTQDISNDGVLAAVILSKGRGTLVPCHLFRKRYPYLWPSAGQRMPILGKRAKTATFEQSKLASLEILGAHFPEYSREIETIFKNYSLRPNYSGFRIINRHL